MATNLCKEPKDNRLWPQTFEKNRKIRGMKLLTFVEDPKVRDMKLLTFVEDPKIRGMKLLTFVEDPKIRGLISKGPLFSRH